MKSWLKSIIRNSFFLSFLVTILLVWFYSFFPPIARIDLLGRDFLFRVRHSLKSPPPEVKNMILVAVDDASTQNMKYKWPLPRIVYADALSKINELGLPKAVGFDFVFQGEDQIAGSDEAFSEMLRKSGNVVIAAYIDRTGRLIAGHPKIQGAAYKAALVNKLIDRDGVIRRAPLFIKDLEGGGYHWSWESEIFFRAKDFLNPKFKSLDRSRSITLESGDQIMEIFSRDGALDIDYTIQDDDIPRVSLEEVLVNSIRKPIFKDKIVLIGLTALAFHDVHETPLGPMSGLTLNANAILTLLRQDFLKRVPLFFNWVLLFLSIWFISQVGLKYSIFRGFAVLFSICFSYIFLEFILLWKNILWDLWFVSLATIVIFLLTLLYRQFQVALENIHLKEESIRDSLTGFYTRRFLEVHLRMDLKKAISSSRAGGIDEVSIVMLDLDNFKLVNDSFGHQEGDRVLKRLGESIRSSVRKDEIVCRYGGDEFCVLLPGTPIQNAVRFAEKLRLLIGNDPELSYTTKTGVQSFRVTGSFGVASVRGEKLLTPENLLRAADQALYKAKKSGRNQVCAFDPEKDVLDDKARD